MIHDEVIAENRRKTMNFGRRWTTFGRRKTTTLGKREASGGL